MHARTASVANRLFRRPSDPYGKLLERCLFWKHELQAGLAQAPLRVAREREAGLPQLTQPLRSEPREVDQPGQREQCLVRRDIGGGLLTTDVLFTRLQGQHEAALAFGIDRLARDPPWHAADELGSRRQKPIVGATVRLVVPGRLAFPDRERAAVGTGTREH